MGLDGSLFFFSSRRRHTRWTGDWSSDVCSSDLLDGADPRRPMVVLRAPRPGDYGWVIQRNAALYAEQYGWEPPYEALVARRSEERRVGKECRCGWTASH